MTSSRSGEVSIHIDAPPEAIWDTLAHIERMGEWSPECYRVEWLEGASSPAKVGARFKGSNKSGWLRWSMPCEVKVADRGRELAWSTMRKGQEIVRWAYRLQPSNGGTDSGVTFIVLTGTGAVPTPIENHQAAVTLGQTLAQKLIQDN